MKRMVMAGFAMLVHLAVCDETTEVYGRLAAHSNLWVTSKLDYKPFDARSSCRSNIVERARLNEAEQQTVFSEP